MSETSFQMLAVINNNN